MNRLVGRRRNPVGEECKLSARAARELYVMHLSRVGEAGHDQHLAFRRMPAGKAGAAELAVTANGFSERGRDLGNAFGNQILVRNNYVTLRESERCEENHGEHTPRERH